MFYDIDTPVTLARLCAGQCDYLRESQITGFRLYLPFTGGPLLERLRTRHGAHSLPLYCSADLLQYAPSRDEPDFDFGYLGTCAADRQSWLPCHLPDLAAARRRVLAEHTADHRAKTLERYIDRAVPRRTVVMRSNRSICHGNA